MKKKCLLVLFLAHGIAPRVLAAEGAWITKSPMPTATSLHSASVVDGKIYVIGGTDNLYGWADYWSTVLVYDPATDTWTKKADMPTGRARLSTSVVEGKIYAIGGSPHRDAEVSTVEVYDPVNDTWTRKTDMPRARNWHSTSVVNGKIYAIGGKIYPSATMVSTVEEYDPVTDAWTRKADMPTARSMHSASVVDGKIYVIGGVASEGGGGPGLSMVEVYDTATDAWTRKANMPTARKALSTSVVNGRIYAIGGTTRWAPCFSTMEEYDPATDTWTTKADMPTARGCHSASVVDGKIYVIGGVLNPSGWQPCFSTVEVYDPNPLIVDFNGDGIVDAADICIMVDYWGTDEPLCDIAPPPFGDGIVDVQDLILLSEHLFEEILPLGCIAYWRLDQSEGNIAHNSAGDNDGICHGEPLWQPTGGHVAGALEFDGIDDYVETGFVLSPADGAISACSWIKGGSPGQVIVSQTDDNGTGQTWLGMDPLDGKLMTGLAPLGGRSPSQPLVSEFVITDGEWHHIGIVVAAYQSMRFRYLYLDGVRVAIDTQSVELPYTNGGLYFGAGKALEAGSFFSGLIDDIRIYDIALNAEEIAVLVQ